MSFRRRLEVQSLESRDLLTADPLPVLLVIADQQDFFYREYNDTRNSLLAADVNVVIAATSTNPSTPHPGSGQGSGSGVVVPDIALANVNTEDYSAIAFVGGWGSSMYQYAFNDPSLDGTTDNFYSFSLYNGDSNLNDGVVAPQKVIVNDLINEFLSDGKYVAGICHGTTVLAWARVDGTSPISGKQVAVPIKDGSPQMFYNGDWYASGYVDGQYDQAIDNGGIPNEFNGQYGDPNTTTDDVVVDGQIITGGDDWAAAYFGTVIAQQVWASMPANEAPTDLDLSAATLPENSAAGTTIGSFSTTDPDEFDAFTYSLVDGAGSTDNALFAIADNTLVSAANLDYEANEFYSIRVRTRDSGGLFFEKTFTVQAANVNESSFNLNLSGKSIDENLPVGSVVGNFVAQDPDGGNSITFSLVAGDGSTDNAQFGIVDGNLQTAASFNFENQSSYRIRVRAEDAGGKSTEANFEIEIVDANESPFDLALSNTTVEEAQPIGSVVGTLSASDPDAADTHTYSLVDGDGAADNASFTIAGTELKSAAILELTTQSVYSIRVRVEDAAGLGVEKVFEIQLTEANDAPVIDNGPTLILPLVARNSVDHAGVPVSIVLVNARDAETPETLGIAITNLIGIDGEWEFAVQPGSPWQSIGNVSDSSALLLKSDALIRFMPARGRTGYAGIMFRAWDGQTGSTGGTTDPASEPDSFSIESETAWIPVGLRNLKYDSLGRWTLPAAKEDATKPATTTAKNVLGFLSTEFAVGTKVGLAVTGSSGNGEWQVRTKGNWRSMGPLSEHGALLLNAADGFRFVPTANWSGEATLTYRAWDMSNGIETTHADVSTQAGFSSESMTAAIEVVPVNDRPMLETSIARLFSEVPQSAGVMVEGSGDIDSTVAGIGILRSQSAGGTWQYRILSTGEWLNLPKVSPQTALVLDPWSEVRFLPDAEAAPASGSLQYRAWDASTGGMSGDRMNSNSTAFSSATETATFSNGNHMPNFLSGERPAFASIAGKTKPVALPLSGILKRMSDEDPGTQMGLAVTGCTGEGNWEYTIDGGKTWHAMGDLSFGYVLLRSTDRVRFIANPGWKGSATLEFAAWDRTMGVAGDRMDVPSDSLSVDRLTATLAV